MAVLTTLSFAAAPARADDPAPAAAATPASASVGDAAAGEKTFAVCKACHQIGATAHNAVGPVLNGVIGRKAGTYPGYSYSEANKNSGLTWDVATMQKYLAGPQKLVPGTKMIYPGFPNNPEKSNNVIAYLAQFNEDGSKK
ncbi:MAG: c-type cytochrome [Janthinobacterium lividum]